MNRKRRSEQKKCTQFKKKTLSRSNLSAPAKKNVLNLQKRNSGVDSMLNVISWR